MKRLICKNNKGLSLIEVIVAGAIGATVTYFAMQTLDISFRGAKSLTITGEKELLRKTIAEQIDCDATFKFNPKNSTGVPLDPNDPVRCNTTSTSDQREASKVLRLVRKEVAGSPLYLTGPLKFTPSSSSGASASPPADEHAGALGEWVVRATCSAPEQSLVIRVARVSGGKFLMNPLTKQLDDFDSPHALLFGGANGGIPLCYGNNGTPGRAAPTPTPIAQPGLPKRFANFMIQFSPVSTSTTGCFNVDLTGAVPQIGRGGANDLTGPGPEGTNAGRTRVSIVNPTNASFNYVSEPFSSTGGVVRGMIAYSRLLVRQSRVNTTTVPSLSLWTGPTGMARICMGTTGDLDPNCANDPNGCQIVASVFVYQM